MELLLVIVIVAILDSTRFHPVLIQSTWVVHSTTNTMSHTVWMPMYWIIRSPITKLVLVFYQQQLVLVISLIFSASQTISKNQVKVLLILLSMLLKLVDISLVAISINQIGKLAFGVKTGGTQQSSVDYLLLLEFGCNLPHNGVSGQL